MCRDQKESRLLKDGQVKAMARDTAHQTAEQILSSNNTWKKPALYDVVYRIPEASLKLARDDRQAGLWYREERKNAEKGVATSKHQPLVVTVVISHSELWSNVITFRSRRLAR